MTALEHCLDVVAQLESVAVEELCDPPHQPSAATLRELVETLLQCSTIALKQGKAAAAREAMFKCHAIHVKYSGFFDPGATVHQLSQLLRNYECRAQTITEDSTAARQQVSSAESRRYTQPRRARKIEDDKEEDEGEPIMKVVPPPKQPRQKDDRRAVSNPLKNNANRPTGRVKREPLAPIVPKSSSPPTGSVMLHRDGQPLDTARSVPRRPTTAPHKPHRRRPSVTVDRASLVGTVAADSHVASHVPELHCDSAPEAYQVLPRAADANCAAAADTTTNRPNPPSPPLDASPPVQEATCESAHTDSERQLVVSAAAETIRQFVLCSMLRKKRAKEVSVQQRCLRHSHHSARILQSFYGKYVKPRIDAKKSRAAVLLRCCGSGWRVRRALYRQSMVAAMERLRVESACKIQRSVRCAISRGVRHRQQARIAQQNEARIAVERQCSGDAKKEGRQANGMAVTVSSIAAASLSTAGRENLPSTLR